MDFVDIARIIDLTAEAAASPRQRANLNLHPTLADPYQRFFNALHQGTYIRPHRHESGRWETFVILGGRAVMLTFDDNGTVLQRAELSPAGPQVAVEIPGGEWHTVAAMGTGTVLLELKPGPYRPVSDKDFASWAPHDRDPMSALIELWYHTARPGDRPPG
ncbi:MAG: WbuC family cupin fold metalloprotein [Acidobacteria bacterium]|nr:WbuC family cupin fold metalloprotein [Acidobacteriota bacterium]